MIIKDGLFWRYDVILTSPRHGSVGKVGQIQVQVATGEVVADDSLRDEYLQQAKLLLASPLSHEQQESDYELPTDKEQAEMTNVAKIAVH